MMLILSDKYSSTLCVSHVSTVTQIQTLLIHSTVTQIQAWLSSATQLQPVLNKDQKKLIQQSTYKNEHLGRNLTLKLFPC